MNLKFIELFSGIGGIRLGLESAAKELNYNTECVFASELDKFCNITYKENFKDAFEISGDIWSDCINILIRKRIIAPDWESS